MLRCLGLCVVWGGFWLVCCIWFWADGWFMFAMPDCDVLTISRFVVWYLVLWFAAVVALLILLYDVTYAYGCLTWIMFGCYNRLLVDCVG